MENDKTTLHIKLTSVLGVSNCVTMPDRKITLCDAYKKYVPVHSSYNLRLRKIPSHIKAIPEPTKYEDILSGIHDESWKVRMIKYQIMKSLKDSQDEDQHKKTPVSNKNPPADILTSNEQSLAKIEAAPERSDIVSSSQAKDVKASILQRYKYVKNDPVEAPKTNYKSVILEPSSAVMQLKVEAYAPPDFMYDQYLRHYKSY